MSVPATTYVVHRAEAIAYEPMLIDGDQIGEVHTLRDAGSQGNQHEACLWHTDAPVRYEYLFTGDESFYVLEGSVSIEILGTGERLQLRRGDMASFAQGTESIWTFSEPFTKFTVISA